MPENKEVLEGKLYAIIGYLWILCFIPLFLKKDNKFAFFHGRQGLVLFIAEIALSVIGIVPILGWAIAIFGWALCSVLALIGIIQALLGNYWKIPVVGDFAQNLNL